MNSVVTALVQACTQAVVYIPLVLGGYITVSLMKLPDIALESAFSFGAVSAYLFLTYAPSISGILGLAGILFVALAGGALVGYGTTLLVQKLKFPHLLSSIVMVGCMQGLTLLMMGTSNRSLAGLPSFLQTNYFSEQSAMFCIVAVVFVFCFLLSRRQLGYACAVYGINKKFFRYHRMDGAYVYTAGVIIAHSLAGLSGYLFAQSNNFVDATSGNGMVLLVITCLIMGKLFIKKQKWAVFSPLVGVIFYLFLQQLLLKCGFDLKLFPLVQALVIIAAVVSHFKGLELHYNDQLGV